MGAKLTLAETKLTMVDEINSSWSTKLTLLGTKLNLKDEMNSSSDR
jgi:hypothetical protein